MRYVLAFMVLGGCGTNASLPQCYEAADCQMGEVCAAGKCSSYGGAMQLKVDGSACTVNSQCESGDCSHASSAMFPWGGFCTKACNTGADCIEEACVFQNTSDAQGICSPSCASDADCAEYNAAWSGSPSYSCQSARDDNGTLRHFCSL